MTTMFLVDVFHSFDRCEYVGIFTSIERAKDGLTTWLNDNASIRDNGYNAEIRELEVDKAYTGYSSGRHAYLQRGDGDETIAKDL